MPTARQRFIDYVRRLPGARPPGGWCEPSRAPHTSSPPPLRSLQRHRPRTVLPL